MTAPTTPRDPFTDEDVRKALDAYEAVMREGLTATQRAAMCAALLAFDAAMEAKGWKRCPRVATKDMKDAAAKAMSPGHRPTPGRVSCSTKHAIRYAAMWDAAPTAFTWES